MKILALDSSSSPASAAVLEDGRILGRFQMHTGLTHSQTLLPMIQGVLQGIGMSVDEMDRIAVSAGPGSFTGVRIGVATVKGLCFPSDKPCVGVSTLEAMAYNFLQEEAVVFALMDARRDQVYNAVFRIFHGKVFRLTPDRVCAMTDLLPDIIQRANEKLIFAGDGAALCYGRLAGHCKHIVLAAENIRYQDAYGVALAAMEREPISAGALEPVYLRLPQAERELKLKKESN